MWMRLYENGIFATRENTALIRSTTLQKSIILYIFELTVFFIDVEQSRGYKTHGIRTTRLQVSRA